MTQNQGKNHELGLAHLPTSVSLTTIINAGVKIIEEEATGFLPGKSRIADDTYFI